MTKIGISKKMTFLLVIAVVIGLMSIQVLAAPLTAVSIWKPTTPAQTAIEPYTVYMDSVSNVERIAWKTFSATHNPGFTGQWRAERYVNNDDSNPLIYSYTFDADAIDQGLVKQQPYHLYIDSVTDLDLGITSLTMGCRTKFPVGMEVKVQSGLGADEPVTVAYVAGSCNGYVKCKATTWAELIGSGDPNYLDGFAHVFTSYSTTTDAAGYVTFTTWHGGDYFIY